MPFILIKNNLKLMLRSKWILILMSIMPVVVIALLTTAFRDLLKGGYEMNDFTAGYRTEEGSFLNTFRDELVRVCEANRITLEEYPEGDITGILKSSNAAVFINAGESDYTIYRTGDYQAEANLLEGILSSFINQYEQSAVLAAYGAEEAAADNGIMEQEAGSGYVERIELQAEPVASASDYYGIVEIVYFIWCGMISLATVVSSERTNRIQRRMGAAPIKRWHLYLGKFIPCIGAICIESAAAVILSVVLLDVHWGNPAGSFGILLLLAAASSAVGILLFYLFKSVVVSIVTGWLILFAMGFTGGTFQTYMYSTISDSIAKLSWQYYINRTLVEFSTQGSSRYTGICVAVLAGILAVSMVLGILLMYRRGEEI